MASKQQFMKEIQEVNAKALPQAVNNFFQKFSTKEKNYENGGVFWPLAKWTHEGFDAAKFATGTAQEDIQKHPILGDCYRVVLMSKSDAGSEGTTRGDNMSFESKLEVMLASLGNLHGASAS